MACDDRRAKRVAYLLVMLGCVLALVVSLQPQPTGAFHLSGAYLLCGLLPYVAYGSFTDIMSGWLLVVAGWALLILDLAARLLLCIDAAAEPDSPMPYALCALLVLLVSVPGLIRMSAGRKNA